MTAPAAPQNLIRITSWVPMSVSEAVSGLQFDIVKTGTLKLTSAKQTFDNYGTKVLVWVTSNIAFSGLFMGVVDGAITSISGIKASDIGGNEIPGVSITY